VPPSGVPAWAVDLRLDELAPLLGVGAAGVERLAVLLEPLPAPDAVSFRQDVFRDLEQPGIGGAFLAFADALAGAGATLDRAARMHHPAERDRWTLDAIERHDAALLALDATLGSAGLLRVASRPFGTTSPR